MTRHLARSSLLLGAIVLPLLLAGVTAATPTEEADDEMRAAAGAFLDALDAIRRGKTLQELEGAERVDWVGSKLRGSRIGRLSETEHAAAHALLRSALGERGHEKVSNLMAVEGAARRDAGRYALTVHGPLAPGRPWGLRLEGHHIFLSLTSVPGEGVSATPMFLGAEPARVQDGHELAGLRALGATEDLARELVQSFDRRQRVEGVHLVEPPPNVLFGPGATDPGRSHGLRHASMRPAQQAKLLALIETWTGTLRDEIAAEHLARIDEAGRGNLRFVWLGKTDPGEPCYWRIQGPRTVIEFDHYNRDPNHIHALWRDLEDDFGASLLARHRAKHHREPPATEPAKSKPTRGKLY